MISTKPNTGKDNITPNTKTPSVKSPASNSSSSKNTTFTSKVEDLVVKPAAKRNSTLVVGSPTSSNGSIGGKSPKDSPTNNTGIKRQSTFIKRASFSEISLQKIYAPSEKSIGEGDMEY